MAELTFKAPSGSSPRPHAAKPVEQLEARRLLATIEGNVWNDTDNDGLRDFFESGQPGVQVYLDLNQNGQWDDGEPITTTNQRGNYRFTGLEPGEYFIGHLPFIDGVEGMLGQTAPGISGRTNVQGSFNIEIVYADANLSEPQRQLVESAVAKWEEVIIGDLPNVSFGGQEIDDLQIIVRSTNIDGPGGVLARAAPTDFRQPTPGSPPLVDFRGIPIGLPYRGFIEIDLSDISFSRAFVDTVVHEIGHVLGIGTIWNQFLSGNNYVGANAVRELNTVMQANVSTVPIDANSRAHWAQHDGAPSVSNLGNELMTPFIDGGFGLPPDANPFAPLSRITAGALEDFGYEINYAGVDTYGPFNIGPLPEDLRPELGFRPFQIGVVLESEGDVYDRAHFGVRFNERPNPFYFNAGPWIQQVGEPIRLLAEIDDVPPVDPFTQGQFVGDPDFRDGVIQMNFYRETNGIPGLQTGEGGDLLIAEAVTQDFRGFYDFFADTEGLELGEHIFYARAYDRAYATRDRMLTVTLVEEQTLPERPTNMRAIGTDSNTIQVNWVDNAEDESGFLLQVSRSPGFDIPGHVTNIWLPPNEGTGPMTYEYTALEGPLQTRYFRVRAYNTAGATVFAGRAEARTLSPREVLVDNLTEDAVEFGGDFDHVIDPVRSVNLSYLRGTTGFVEMNPGLQASGEYFIFLRNIALADAGTVAVLIFDEEGELLDEVEVDQAAGAGADVLVGRFQLGEGSFVRIEPREGVARIDTVRFLPVG